MSHCCAIEGHFDEGSARGDLNSYRKYGARGPTALLIEGLRETGLSDASMLDIGGGIGILHHELMGDVVSRVQHNDVSEANIAAMRKEASHRGTSDRITVLAGDFVERREEAMAADIVTMDRVLCCFHDPKALLDAALPRARRYFAASYPPDKWFVKLGFFLDNGRRRLKRDLFRSFVHPVAMIENQIADAGFGIVWSRDMAFWRVRIWEAPSKA